METRGNIDEDTLIIPMDGCENMNPEIKAHNIRFFDRLIGRITNGRKETTRCPGENVSDDESVSGKTPDTSVPDHGVCNPSLKQMNASRSDIVAIQFGDQFIDFRDNDEIGQTRKPDGMRKLWADACDGYLRRFMEKHGIEEDYEYAHGHVWMDGPGSIAHLADMDVNMDDMRYDIDNEVPEEKFGEWYWKSVERAGMELPYMNYRSFCEGCPDPIPEEKEIALMELRKRVAEARKILDDAVDDFNEERNNIKNRQF